MKRIILFLCDALRLDYAVKMKSFQYLAERGMVFPLHKTTNTWTYPALGTIHSGRLASDHGVLTWRLDWGKRPVLKADKVLAEAAKELGLSTAGFGTMGWGGATFGWDRGFDSWHDRLYYTCHFPEIDLICAEVGCPQLTFIHNLSVHDWFHGTSKSSREWRDLNADEKLTDNDRVVCIEAYQEACDKFDGHFLEWLKTLNIGPETVFVLFADHGEAFWEYAPKIFAHEIKSHPPELMNIPFVIAGGDMEPGSEYGFRSFDFDFMPTIVGLMSRLTGRSSKLPTYIDGRDLLQDSGKERPTKESGDAEFTALKESESQAVAEKLRDLGYL